jgi:hypothetical protein
MKSKLRYLILFFQRLKRSLSKEKPTTKIREGNRKGKRFPVQRTYNQVRPRKGAKRGADCEKLQGLALGDHPSIFISHIHHHQFQ